MGESLAGRDGRRHQGHGRRGNAGRRAKREPHVTSLGERSRQRGAGYSARQPGEPGRRVAAGTDQLQGSVVIL